MRPQIKPADVTPADVVLATSRLELRSQTEADAAFILALVNDPLWLRYIGDRGVRTLDDARRYIREGALKMYNEHGFGLYLVVLRETRTPVGICGLVRREGLDDVDLGFAFVPEFRGKGYAREAAEATVAYARDVLGLRRIVAIAAPDNAASLKLLKGLGFTLERPLNLPDGDMVHLLSRHLAEQDA